VFADLGDIVRLGLQIGRLVEAYEDHQTSKYRAETSKNEAIEATSRAKAESAALQRSQLAEKVAQESVAVSCQSCGARLAIRKHSIAFCSYCGSAIRVDRNGNASVLSPEQRKAIIAREKAKQGG